MTAKHTLFLFAALPLLSPAATWYRTGGGANIHQNEFSSTPAPLESSRHLVVAASDINAYIVNTDDISIAGNAFTAGNGDGIFGGPGSGFTLSMLSGSTEQLNFSGTGTPSAGLDTYTIPHMVTGNDAIVLFNNGANPTLTGQTWTLDSGITRFRAHNSQTTDSILTVGHDLTGVGTIHVTQNPLATGQQIYDFTGTGSDWAGPLIINSWQTETDDSALVRFATNNDLNTARMGSLHIGYGGMTASTNMQLDLNQGFTFQNATLQWSGGNVSLPSGKYSYADLALIPVGSGSAADFFVDNGGTINVIAVPEPSTFGLLTIGAVMLRRRIRKRN